MAKKRLTPMQKEWEKEYGRLQRRAREWVEKFHAVYEMPQKPKRITKQAIENLRNIRWPKLSKETKDALRKEYAKRYEEGLDGVYFPKPPYKPPTEEEFLKIPYKDILPKTAPPTETNDEPDEDGYTETVVSRDEIEAWIERTIDTITVDHELYGVREQLKDLVLEAADAYGDYAGYLNYLESQAATLTELATKAIYGYRDRSGNIHQHDESALPQFATVLNLGRPLESSQSERLDEEGWVSFDFND